MNTQHIKNKTKAVWGAKPAGSSFADDQTPGTKQFFATVLEKRFSYECDWLDDIVLFKEWHNKKVLEVGCGAGYDAYMFCAAGADYTGIDLTPENPLLLKKHLSYYGFEPEALEQDIETLAMHETFDFVYSFGVLHHTPNIEQSLNAIYSALKPGGQAELIVYHKHSMFHWVHLYLFDWLVRGKWTKMPFKDRLAQIEYTTADELPLVNVYSKKEFSGLLQSAGFKIKAVRIRKLTREEFPCIPYIDKLYRFIPDSILKLLSKKIGWYLCIRAQKP